MNKRQKADDFPLRNHNIKKPRKRQGDDLTLKSESEKKTIGWQFSTSFINESQHEETKEQTRR